MVTQAAIAAQIDGYRVDDMFFLKGGPTHAQVESPLGDCPGPRQGDVKVGTLIPLEARVRRRRESERISHLGIAPGVVIERLTTRARFGESGSVGMLGRSGGTAWTRSR